MSSYHITVRIAQEQDIIYANTILKEIESSAKQRGTGIAKRSPDLIVDKIKNGQAVIAFTDNNEWVGFCYLQSWNENEFVSHGALIINPVFRKNGIAKRIKEKIVELTRQLYPQAKMFGLTTSLAVMKINSELGFEPVTYSEITQQEEFWNACKACVNHDTLMSKQRKTCFCTAMLYQPINNSKNN